MMDILERLRSVTRLLRRTEEVSYEQDDTLASEAADEIEELRSILREIVSQIEQGGSDGKVFARDNCIQRARTKLSSYK